MSENNRLDPLEIIKKGLSEPIKAEDTSKLNCDSVGQSILNINKSRQILHGPTSITKFRFPKEEVNPNTKNTDPTE